MAGYKSKYTQLLLLFSFIMCSYNLVSNISYASFKTKLNTNNSSLANEINGYQPMWWKEAVVYQVYIRSFKDSNGDGIGDLKGVIEKLDYLKNLGIDVIWISPHYDSPNVDNGYDIRDYQKIMKEFGTMQDFDTLLAEVKKRKMKLIVDLVVNHTSDEHEWFVESRKGKDNPYRDFYIWRTAANGSKPNNYTSFFSGSAWTRDKQTSEHYLHLFAKKQPDLNWDNPKVRIEVYKLMKYWLDKGVDGFRMDVIPFISKDQKFKDLTADELNHPETVYANGPHLHDYLQEMNHQVLSKYDVMTVGEAFGISLKQTPLLVDERRHELNMIFNFDIIRLPHDGLYKKDWQLTQLKKIYAAQNEGLDNHSWNTIFISNHDNPRAVSTFGNDSSAHHDDSAKLLATMLLTLKGTPYIFQGDELGMTNYPFKSIDEFNDIWAHNGWKDQVESGKMTADEYMKNLRAISRDNSRTPMQWDNTVNAGFTTNVKPWLAVNPNYKGINAKEQFGNSGSVYNYFRRLIALRKQTPALIYGNYSDLDPNHKDIYIYTRELKDEKFLVVLNFSSKTINYTLPNNLKAKQLIITNQENKEENCKLLHLQAWEARIYRQ